MKNYLIDAIKILGSQRALANSIGVRQQHIYNWLYRDKKIPAEYVLKIEKVTNNRVKRYELRPDIYPPEEYSSKE